MRRNGGLQMITLALSLPLVFTDVGWAINLEAISPQQLEDIDSLIPAEPIFLPRSGLRSKQSGSSDDRQAEANRLLAEGIEQYNLSDWQAALATWQQALTLYQDIGDRAGEAQTLNNIGNMNGLLGNYPAALKHFEQSLVIKREMGDRAGEAGTLGNIGNVNQFLGDYTAALENYTQSLEIKRELDDRTGEADTLNNIGVVNQFLGNYTAALEYYVRSLAITQEIGNRATEALNFNNIGAVNQLLGDYTAALENYTQSLVIKRQIGDRATEVGTLNNIGIVNEAFGNYPAALENYEQSLAISRQIGDLKGEAQTLNNIGSVNRLLGNYPVALDYSAQSLVITQEIGDLKGEAQTLNNIGLVNEDFGNHLTALENYEQSLVISQKIGDRTTEAVTLGNIGNVNQLLGNYPAAWDYYQKSLVIIRDIGDRTGEAQALNNIGEMNRRLENYLTALENYEKSLVITREISDRATEAQTLNNMGRLFEEQKKPELSEEFFFEAIVILEDLRDPDLSDESKINLFEIQVTTYKGLERAFAMQDKHAQALEIVERGRARAFIEQLAERLSRQQAEQLSPEPPSFSDIQRIAQAQRSVLIEYSLQNEDANPFLYIWVIQPSGELTFRKVDLNDDALALTELLTKSRETMGVRGRGSLVPVAPASSPTETLRQLHQLLIEPIADLLPTDPEARITFIPDRELFLVPFPALIDDEGSYLIKRHTLSTAPSIQTLALTRRQRGELKLASTPGGDDILIVGNPVMPQVWSQAKSALESLSNLPGAEREANTIADFFDADALIKEHATEQAVRQRIENARLIHLATHGLLEYGNPQDSGVRDVPGAIALAPSESNATSANDTTQDGLLTSTEIINDLTLQAELVVLSACDTGLGRITGDGVIGLSRSLILAGTPSIVVSLWSVPDAPTADLMEEFYRQLRQGEDKAQALRKAMLLIMETHPAPKDWAAFTLIGEV